MTEDKVYEVTVYSDGRVIGWFEIEAPTLAIALILAAAPKHVHVLMRGEHINISLVTDPS